MYKKFGGGKEVGRWVGTLAARPKFAEGVLSLNKLEAFRTNICWRSSEPTHAGGFQDQHLLEVVDQILDEKPFPVWDIGSEE